MALDDDDDGAPADVASLPQRWPTDGADSGRLGMHHRSGTERWRSDGINSCRGDVDKAQQGRADVAPQSATEGMPDAFRDPEAMIKFNNDET